MSVLSSLTSCLHFESSRVQKVGTMPDSPADVKTQPRSTPPTMPPPPPAVSQATNRSASFTPTTSKSSIYRCAYICVSLGVQNALAHGTSVFECKCECVCVVY
ncbi:hypothetical protein INR49_003116, partial [Caranx melampygus]